jgi:hypothetical protein
MEHLKKINMRILIMLLLATQIQAQINQCDSITYWTDQGQGLSVGIDTSTIPNGFDSIDIYWGVCNSSICYTGSGINSFFGQITTSDTIKVCYNIILYTANTFETCPEYCDSLIYDGFSWVLFSMGNPVGIVEIQNKINNNKMYDLFGREILRPKGFYIQNNKIKYER